MTTTPLSIREQLLALDERCFEQPASDWAGEIALPAELERFYREVGPCDCNLDTAGNPFFIPSLAKLWKQQAGYRWHGLTGERLAGWSEDWIVVADQGADPFILECSSGRILFDQHGGPWDPAPMFDDLWQMTACLATFARVWRGAGEDIFAEDYSVNPLFRRELIGELAQLLGDARRAEDLADEFGW
jgi:hypothetical protein